MAIDLYDLLLTEKAQYLHERPKKLKTVCILGNDHTCTVTIATAIHFSFHLVSCHLWNEQIEFVNIVFHSSQQYGLFSQARDMLTC